MVTLASFDWTLSAIISVCALLFGGLITFVWKDLYEKKSKKHKERKRLEQKEQADQQASTIREIIKEENTIVVSDIKSVKDDLKNVSEQITIIGEGTQSTLRNQLLTCFYKCNEKKYRTENDTMNFTDMYESYHKLKGNSFIEKDIKPQFYALPLKREAQVSKTSKKNSRRIKKVVFEESPSKIEEEVKHEG